MSRTKKTTGPLIIGGLPRVDLLPPEVKARQRGKGVRRNLVVLLVVLLATVIAAAGGANYLSIKAQQLLTAEQSKTQDLLSQQAKFSEVRVVQDQLGLVKAAQTVGASTEVDWSGYLSAIQRTLPAGVSIESVNIAASSPIAPVPQATGPLQGARVATLMISASSPTLPAIPAWLDALSALPGFVDAVPGSVTQNGTGGGYTTSVTMHVGEGAYDHRFAAEGGK